MRRHPHSRLRPVIHQHIPRHQFPANFRSVRTLHRHRPRPLRRIFRRIHPPTARLRSRQQPRRQSQRFLANRRDPHLINDLQPRLARIQRRNMRRAVQKTKRILASVNRAGLKSKRAPVRQPSRQRRPQFRAQIFTHVQIRHARPAAQPFQNAAHREIHVQRSHIQRYRAGP